MSEIFRFFRLLSPRVFWPPFALLTGALLFSLLDEAGFLAAMNATNSWILKHFDWLFSWTSLLMLVLCVVVLVSPAGKVKIGGPKAIPLFSRWKWFSIVLCTTVAVGILFWGTAEPLYHLKSQPVGLGLESGSVGAQRFALSTVFLHWSFTPYAIYAIPALLFAIAYYNRKQPFSLGSMLFPLGKVRPLVGDVVSAICLFALVAGMAAALGAGILSLSRGLTNLLDFGSGRFQLLLVAASIVITFTISAATGLQRGIKNLSVLNIGLFVSMSFFVLIVGPTRAIFEAFGTGLVELAGNFWAHSTGSAPFDDEAWTHGWTTFYWANWMAWAPVTALFLGRIAYGRTVREFLIFNWIFPALFSIGWMSIYSGSTLHAELEQGAGLAQLLETQGPESIVYGLFEQLPASGLLAAIFVFAIFISYVTAADSNTEAMAGLSARGISPESPNPPVLLKFAWGMSIGLVAWVMVSYAGIDGVKMLSNLGGLPALFLLIACSAGLVVWLIRGAKGQEGG